MKRSKFTEEQITCALRQHDAGTPVGDICCQLGVSEASYYVWKEKYAHMGIYELRRCIATFKKQQEGDELGRPGSVSCSHLELRVDELNLLPNIRTAHPPRLPLPDHVHGLVSLDRSPCCVEFAKALL